MDIHVNFKDKDYEKNFALSLAKNCIMHRVVRAERNEDCFYISDTEDADLIMRFVSPRMLGNNKSEKPVIAAFQPIEDITKLINGYLTKGVPDFSYYEIEKPESCRFTAFTSGKGGAGVTSCAMIYGRIRSRIYGKKVLLVELDTYPVQFEEILERSELYDEYGLNIYKKSGSLKNGLYGLYDVEYFEEFMGIARRGYDEVVICIPRAHQFWQEIINMCERQIVVYSWNENLHYASRDCYEELMRMRGLWTGNAPAVYEFKPSFDADAFNKGFCDDIHGRLGTEVKQFARELEIN